MIIGLKAPMPPSANEAHRVVGKHIVKSDENKDYQNSFSGIVMNENPHLLQIPEDFISRGGEYSILAVFFVTKLLRKTRGKDTIFLKEDVDNRIKILGDCLKRVLGVDDTNFFDIRLKKRLDEEDGPYVEVYIQKIGEYLET